MKWLVLVSLFVSVVVQAGYKNESEAGAVISSGNSRSQSYHIKQLSAYEWEKNKASLSGGFLQVKSAGVLSTKKWDSSLRYDRGLNDVLSAFLSQGIESDRFAGYMQMYNSDIGGKYIIWQKEKDINWFAEAGYRYTKERRIDSSKKYKNQARLYSEVQKQWNEVFFTKLWLQYVPNFSQSADWRLDGETSANTMLNSILSWKVAYKVEYRNEPASAAAEKTDRIFTTALVAKF